jgi:hypothetical protein
VKPQCNTRHQLISSDHRVHPHHLQACEQVYELKPQELANIMWALASHEALDDASAAVLGGWD